jgi:hypothetical protein
MEGTKGARLRRVGAEVAWARVPGAHMPEWGGLDGAATTKARSWRRPIVQMACRPSAGLDLGCEKLISLA